MSGFSDDQLNVGQHHPGLPDQHQKQREAHRRGRSGKRFRAQESLDDKARSFLPKNASETISCLRFQYTKVPKTLTASPTDWIEWQALLFWHETGIH